MKKFKGTKKLIALLLSLSLITGMMPATAWNAFAAEAQADNTTYVLAGGDFQEAGNHSNSATNVANILAQVNKKYSTMDGFLFVGDYDCETHNDATETANGINALMGAVQSKYSNLNDTNSVLVQGNHDYMDSRIDATGGHDFDGYSVYVLNEDDYVNGGGSQSGVQTLANNMKTWLNNKVGEGYEKPIFITSHLPLAFTPRTVTQGDAKYAKYIFDVLNDAAENGLNIIFMHGHDHAYGPDNYMGGEAIYLKEGDKICIAEAGSTSKWTEEELNFTYMNAGYTGYYSDAFTYVTTAGTDKLTMTVFAIKDNEVTVERYSEDGLYNLKSAGYDGSYSNTSVTNVSLGLPMYSNIYSSPQTIELAEAQDYGATIGEYVEVTPEVTDDVTTSGNAWTTITGPVNGTTTYTYELTNAIVSGESYLIGSSNNGTVRVLDSSGNTISGTTTNGVFATTSSVTDAHKWNFEGSGTSYTIQNVSSGGYLYPTASRRMSWSYSLETDGSETSVTVNNNSGALTISRYVTSGSRNTTSYMTSSFGANSTGSAVYIYKIVENTTDGTNGIFGRLAGNLTYNVSAGMTANEALAGLKGQVDGYSYAAMSTPGSNVTGTQLDDSALTWTLDPNYDGNVPGDYAVTISYNGNVLGTAEVVVPATSTYYIAEGNGLYLVDPNTTEANAMAAVKAGVTVYSATDKNDTGKTVISDNDVTWSWVDSYNGADSGPYTVEILKDEVSLGTVEVKVNIKYETGINSDWTYIGESEATGGTYYERVEDINNLISGEEYLIIFDCSSQTANDAFVIPEIVTYNSGSNLRRGADVVVSNGISDNAIITGDYDDYLWTLTKSGSGWKIGNGTQFINVANNSTTSRGELSFTNTGEVLTITSGSNNPSDANSYSYAIRDSSSLYWQYNTSATLIYATDGDDYTSRFVFYKRVEESVTPGGSIYAKIDGNTVYSVNQGTSATQAMAVVKAGITGYISSNADGSNPTELDDKALTWKWKNTYSSTVTGSYWVEISYNGKVLGTVEVKVRPGVINNYPEYPDEGAVKVNKSATGIDFQSSGIAQVEVSASGVPVKKGADVIVMLDTSSSMAYCLDCNNTRHDSYKCNQGGQTRAQALEDTLGDMIENFKKPGDDGQVMDIDVAIADFNGFYGNNHSASGTPYDRDSADTMSDDIAYTANSEAKVYTNNTGALDATAFIPAEDLADSYTLNYTSGTNYDYAMDAIYQMATAKKIANGAEERDLYVIFMSDGAAMQWNYYHSQGKSSTWNNWLKGSWKASDLTTANLNCTTHAYYYDEGDHDGDGDVNEHRMANAIKGDPNKTYEVIRKTSDLGTATAETNMYMVPGLGAKMFAIAYDPMQDTNVTVDSMVHSIKTLASDQTGTTQYFYNVGSAEELSTAFTAIGSEIAYAASNARFVDQMGDDFNLQMAPAKYEVVQGNATVEKTITPKIEIITYDIYTRQDFEKGTITADKIGDRKGTSTVAETVTFGTNDAGEVVAAYSDQIDGGKTNILADGTQAGYTKGVIYAKTFIYNTNPKEVEITGVSIPTGKKSDNTTTGSTNVLPSETFYWKMGTVQSSELAMRYYVYLDGSMEGTKAAGAYATNEYATLYYDNYLGKPCYKETVSPILAWKSANVSYAFYLVNDKGEIIVNQTTGETGSFANKVAVTKPVVYDEIFLNNQEHITSLNVKAISDDVLPKYYELYDEAAVYDVTINSNSTGNWVITKGENLVNSTYVTNYKTDDPSKYSNELTNGTIGDDYTHTTVWFAVVWKVEAHPDAVVVDYGLPVDIDVLSNDMFGDYGKLDSIGTYTDKLEEITAGKTLKEGFKLNYAGEYGTAKATPATGKVRYTLNTMEMDGYDKFAYAVNYIGTENAGYYYDTITVIPATTIYYEDDFLTYTASGTEWTEADEANKVTDATQDEDRPGEYSLTDANNIYGYDSVNKGMSTFSLGSAKKVHVDADSYATAEFSFCGTGFDVVGMTSNTTGVITVEVLDENNETVEAKVVNTYYGYTVNDEGEWVATPDTENSLYQVPVIQVENLPYGKYKAIITATYAEVFDKTTPEGYDLYLDAIRIYDPANDGAVDNDEVIENAYKADGEGWPSYIELRNKLIDTATLGNAQTDTKITGLVFIDGDSSVGDAQIDDYQSYGPNNEVYLAPGQSVAFILNAPENAENIHIGIKGTDGNNGTYTITNVAKENNAESNILAGHYYNARTFTMDTATEMYYDITGYKNDIIVISNTGDKVEPNTSGIISLTNIKSTYKSNPNGNETTNTFSLARNGSDGIGNETSIYMTPAAATLTLKSLNSSQTPEDPDTPVTPEEPDTPVTPEDPDTPVVPENPVEPEDPETPPVVEEPEEPVATPAKIVSLKTDKQTYVQGDKVKVTVTTNKEATKVKVGTKVLKNYTTKNGNRTWTTTVNATKLGKLTIGAIAYNGKGTATKKVTKVVTVKKFAPRIFNVTLNKYKVKKGQKYTVTVKAGSSVKHVRVNGKKITKFTTKNGVKTFKVTFKANKVGKQKVKVIAYNKALYPSNPKFRTVTVTRK